MREDLLTQYALSETTAEQSTEIEAYLADHPDAAEFVEEVRADAALLTSALQAEPDLPAANETYRMQEYVMEPKREKHFNVSALAIAAAVALMVVGFLAVREGGVNVTAIALNETATPSSAREALLDDYQDQLESLRRQGTPEAMKKADAIESYLGATDGYADLDESSEIDGVVGPVPSEEVADAMPGARGRGLRNEAAEGRLAEAEMSDSLAVMPASPPSEPRPQQFRFYVRRDAGGRESGAYGGGGGLDDHRQHGLDAAPTDREAYDHTPENDFIAVGDAPLSTFSIDVDTASFTNVRRMLMAGQLPPADAVRVEEFVNYFDYGYAAPSLDDEHPFAAHLAVAQTPWNPSTKLVRIGLKGKEIPAEQRPDMNLVFLLDVSGSMNNPKKLPLVKSAMTKLAGTMRDNDRVAIVVYAGAAGLVLDSTTDAEQVVSALAGLGAGGSTAGGAGIELAYATAEKHFIEDGVNRVILATDGDFNVGTSDTGGLVRLVEDKAKAGVYLTVLGFGSGNLNDAMMEQISNKGEGNYAYIDSEAEAQRVLVDGAGGTLQAIAKDVKIQVEFNPATVASYRLIGYENRKLADRDFNDDTKDAGDIGVGHTVTALYEIVPAELDEEALAKQKGDLQEQIDAIRDLMNRARLTQEAVAALNADIALIENKIASLDKMLAGPMVDELKYQEKPAVVDSPELLTVKLRYKQPDAPKEQGTSKLMSFPLEDAEVPFAEADKDFKQAASAAAFAMLLRESPHAGTATLDWVIEMTTDAELKELAAKAKALE
ncbi:MAG: von Willebrand factor type A domain-containing protein [Planctomycetota bacterium]